MMARLEIAESEAAYALGDMFDQRREMVEAAHWYRVAADAGDARAANRLGEYYYVGSGVAQDPAEAVRWFRKAAERGIAGANYSVGYAFLLGVGLGADTTSAQAWWERGAAAGDPESTLHLGLGLLDGTFPTDTVAGIELVLEAADAGHETAVDLAPAMMFNLGLIHLVGQSVPADTALAQQWWRRAAAAHQPDAMFSLGRGLIRGVFPPDTLTGVQLVQRAAEAGHAGAIQMLPELELLDRPSWEVTLDPLRPDPRVVTVRRFMLWDAPAEDRTEWLSAAMLKFLGDAGPANLPCVREADETATGWWPDAARRIIEAGAGTQMTPGLSGETTVSDAIRIEYAKWCGERADEDDATVVELMNRIGLRGDAPQTTDGTNAPADAVRAPEGALERITAPTLTMEQTAYSALSDKASVRVSPLDLGDRTSVALREPGYKVSVLGDAGMASAGVQREIVVAEGPNEMGPDYNERQYRVALDCSASTYRVLLVRLLQDGRERGRWDIPDGPVVPVERNTPMYHVQDWVCA